MFYPEHQGAMAYNQAGERVVYNSRIGHWAETFTCAIYFTAQSDPGTIIIIVPTLQMSKLRFREVKQLTQGYIASKW